MSSARKRLERLLRDESAQAMTEYIIVFISLLVPIFIMTAVMSQAVRRYLIGIYSFMTYPFP